MPNLSELGKKKLRPATSDTKILALFLCASNSIIQAQPSSHSEPISCIYLFETEPAQMYNEKTPQ